MVTRIFVYGTLKKPNIMKHILGMYYEYMEFIEVDGVFGALFHTDAFPQLLLFDALHYDFKDIVEGEVWEIDSDDESIVNTILAKLDMYESVETGLFTRRETITVLGSDVYVYEYTGMRLGKPMKVGVWNG